MKKLLLCAAVAVFGFSNVNAQDFNFGVKAGVNFATLGGDIEENDMKVGFHVGGVAEFMFNEKMGIQGELLYSTQGTKFEYSEQGFSEEETWKLNYINIPVSFKYYIVKGFNVEAGPQLGILASGKYDYEYSGEFGGVAVNESEEGDLEGISSIDFGFNIGAGYKMENGLNFGARYNLGLMNLNDEDYSDEFLLNNGVFQLSVGYMF
ncbi:porin family protein [Mangrovimonas sp. YM274]|uniref:porin family protein n=1 Tax=Mangrovimonas sp. YM274 TaxID=3070660 RepID=UPI0027DD805D|nr:porin family protein [Mangrovimonas sp. YM274]WMI67163.1 porin family protein [Mangrovimonas sp. YM274]